MIQHHGRHDRGRRGDRGPGGGDRTTARHHMGDGLARDAHAQSLALHLDLGELGFVEQLGQLADQVLFVHSVARS
jgi:hypothetical protein